MTNIIFVASQKKDDRNNSRLLIRIYGEGTDLFIHRREEIKLLQLLSDENMGIGLIGEFINGRFEKYVDGKVCKRKDMKNPCATVSTFI